MRAHRITFARFACDDKSIPFADRCMALKNRFRGKGQYNYAQVEASSFLKENIQPNLDSWLTLSSACAAISVMSFFEVDHPQKAEISAWIFSRLTSLSMEEKIEAGQALLQADIAKYRDSVRGSVIVPLISDNITQMSAGQLSILCKMMQRCGNDIPSNLWEPVAMAAQRRLTGESMIGEVVRFFSAFARAIPSSPVTQAILQTLLTNLSDLKAFDYATIVNACSRMHASEPMKLVDFRCLASQAGEYGNMNCRDIGTVLSNIMRMRASYTATPENVEELWAVDNTIQVVLHTLNRSSIKFMDPTDESAWSSETDIVALVFAFESSGGKYEDLFTAFDKFVRNQVQKMEGRNLALSLGILRRTGKLDDDLAARFSDRIAEVMDDFILTELSHVVFTYNAARGQFPTWLDRARTRISTLLSPETPAHARLNIRVAFPNESALVSNVNLSEISFRQLADVLRATTVDPELRKEVLEAFKKSLENIIAPNCAEVEIILDVARQNLFNFGDIAKTTAKRILALDNWPVDVAELGTLFDSATKNEVAKKAVANAYNHCVSAAQFVSMARTLLNIFPKNDDVIEWVVDCCRELVKPHTSVMLFAIMSLLDIIAQYEIPMSEEWYVALLYGPISESATHMTIPMIAALFKHLITLGVPSPHKEPVSFLLEQACDRHKSIAELTPVIVTAAKLQCVPLDAFLAEQVLQHGTDLSEADRAAINAAEKLQPPLQITIKSSKDANSEPRERPPRDPFDLPFSRGAPKSHAEPMSLVKGGNPRLANPIAKPKNVVRTGGRVIDPYAEVKAEMDIASRKKKTKTTSNITGKSAKKLPKKNNNKNDKKEKKSRAQKGKEKKNKTFAKNKVGGVFQKAKIKLTIKKKVAGKKK